MKNIVLILLSFLVIYESMACSCKTFSKSVDFDFSEVVLMGEITASNENVYSIKVLEIFKNDYYTGDTTLVGEKDQCSVNPKVGETWLIYANKSVKGIYASSCGFSRSFNQPRVVNGGWVLPPRPSDYPLTQNESDLVNSINKSQLLNELYYDILTLRQMKLSKEVSVLKHSKSDLEMMLKIDQIHHQLFIAGIIMFFLLLIIFFFLNKIMRTK